MSQTAPATLKMEEIQVGFTFFPNCYHAYEKTLGSIERLLTNKSWTAPDVSDEVEV